MTVVKINAITVPADGGDELARRFAARAGAVDNQDGFEGFELLKPADERTTWLVVTRWRDEASFEAWLRSTANADGHRSAAERSGGEARPARSASAASCGPTRWLVARPGETPPGQQRAVGGNRDIRGRTLGMDPGFGRRAVRALAGSFARSQRRATLR